MKEELRKLHLAEARAGGLRKRVAALQIIVYRLIQAIGGASLFADSAAILTDAFPPDQRGTAMGISGAAGATAC